MRRVAIVGAGIGAQHAEAYAALPEQFELALVCDLDAQRAKALCPRVETDLDRVLASDDVDLIDICLPSHMHTPVALKALSAGKHVICEKPVAASLADIDRLAAAEGTARIFPVFQYRFGLGTAQMARAKASGWCDTFLAGSLETHWNRDAAYYSIPWRGTWAGEQGGVLVTHAIHIHDLLVAILGPVNAVSATTATRVNDIETEDCAALTLEIASGGLVTSSATLGAAQDTSRLRLVFSDVTIESGLNPYAPASDSWRFMARNPDRQSELDAITDIAKPPTGYVGLFTEISKALDGKSNNAVTLSDARNSAEIITGAYLSASTGQRVELPISKKHPRYSDWGFREL